MERVLLLMESWGYPKTGTDWLRRRRLLVICALALLGWGLFALVALGIHFLVLEFSSLIGDLADQTPRLKSTPASTPR